VQCENFAHITDNVDIDERRGLFDILAHISGQQVKMHFFFQVGAKSRQLGCHIATAAIKGAFLFRQGLHLFLG